MVNFNSASENGAPARLKRAAKAAVSGARDGIARIKLNKTQAGFVVIAFAAAVFAAVAIGLALNSSALNAAYASNPLGADTVALKINGERTGITADGLTSLASENLDLFEAVVPFAKADGVELRGTSGKGLIGTAIVTDDLFFEYGAIDVTKGAELTRAGLGKSEALISEDLAEGLFGEAEPVGQSVRINNRSYDVIGLFGGKNGCDLSGSVILPSGAARLVLNSSEPNEYVFITRGDTDAALKKIDGFVNSNMNKVSGGSCETEILGKTSDGPSAAWIALYILMLIICGITLVMFLLFPSRKAADFSEGFAAADKYIYILKRGICPSFLLALVGSLIGAALGIGGAAAYTALSGGGFFMSVSAAAVPLVSAPLFAVLAAAAAETIKRPGGRPKIKSR